MPAWGRSQAPRLDRLAQSTRVQVSVFRWQHEFMVRGDLVLTIPNPHRGDIGVALLALILRQVGIIRKGVGRLLARFPTTLGDLNANDFSLHISVDIAGGHLKVVASIP